MKKFLFEGEGGVALIAVVLTVALVLGLFVMTFTSGTIGHLVTESHFKTRTSAQCGQEAIVIANKILVQTANQGLPAVLPAGVAINGEFNNPNVLNNAALNDFYEEVRSANVALALAVDLPVPGGANITVNSPPVAPVCTTLVDVDYMFYHNPDGTDQGTFEAFHTPVGGAGCQKGTFYAVQAVTQILNPATGLPTGVSTTEDSVFFKCGGRG